MTAADAADTPSRLVLSPFRGLRFTAVNPGGVISPPYDMIDPDRAQQLAQSDEHNIVRVILPELDEPDPLLRYRRAAETLRDWRRKGLLALDPVPALYVYEQVDGDGPDATLQRGLIGALLLPPSGDAGAGTGAGTGAAVRPGTEPDARAGNGTVPGNGAAGLISIASPFPVHPHEDVVDAVVQDRCSLMYALGANPEPILLTYRGGGAASELVERVADGEPPLGEARTEDGIRHRLWAVAAPEDIAAVTRDLAEREALIADGHHRFAAYRRLAALGRPGTEYGLALLVDSTRHPLRVRGIHRWLPDVQSGPALRKAGQWFTVRELDGGYQAALEALDEANHPAGAVNGSASTADGTGAGAKAAASPNGSAAPATGAAAGGKPRTAFAIVDGHKAWLLTDPDERLINEYVPHDRPEAWRRLDATVLHLALAGGVWQIPDTPEHIRFDHDPRSAVREARRHSGIAVLLRPVAESTVLELAAAGVMMPRKSTSFSPKPATGIVLRLLDEAAEN